MKVIYTAKISIYVYRRDHLPPHCHVRFNDRSEICVTLPLIESLYGDIISQEVRELVEENLELLLEAGEKFHPMRKKQTKTLVEKR